jgi:hypothetical protein
MRPNTPRTNTRVPPKYRQRYLPTHKRSKLAVCPDEQVQADILTFQDSIFRPDYRLAQLEIDRLPDATIHSPVTNVLQASCLNRNRDDAVGVATTLRDARQTNRGSNPDTGNFSNSSSKRPQRLWGPPSLLLNSYRGSCSTIKNESYQTPHPPIWLHGLYRNFCAFNLQIHFTPYLLPFTAPFFLPQKI